MLGTKADFSQNDPQWKKDKLGFSTWQTMGAFGCVVTTIANIAQAHGHDVTPADVNRLLKEMGQFVYDGYKPPQKSDVAGAGAVPKIFPDITHIETKDWGSKLADIRFFDIRNSKTDDIWVKIDYHPEKSGIQQHHCRVIGTNPQMTDVEVVDSYTGKRIWLSSLGAPANKLIFRAYKFRGPGTGFKAGIPASPQPKMATIRMKGDKKQYWNVRTSPDFGDNIVQPIGKNPMKAIGTQTYSAEILESGWARILFNSRTVYISPNTYTRA